MPERRRMRLELRLGSETSSRVPAVPRPARSREMAPRIPEPAVAPASRDAEGVASDEPRSGLPSAFQGTELPRPEQARRRAVGRPGRVSGMIKHSEPI
jgi:hypothetical protein